MTARRPKETPAVALERRYPATPEAVGIARGSLDDLVAHFQPTCLDNLKLLLSEVVTNAIRHGPQGDDASIVMRVVVRDETVRAEVADGGPGFAPPRGPAADGSSGWGLYLVDRLADRWGVRPGPPTRVWFEIDRCVFPAGERRGGPWPDTWDPQVMDSLGVAVVAVDADGVVTRWNSHAQALYGLEAQEALGRKVIELVAAPEHLQTGERVMERIRAGEPWEGEWEVPRPDGSKALVRTETTPVRDEAGTLLGAVAVSFDVRRREGDVTRRRPEETAAQDSEERLRIALSAGAMGAWDWNVVSGELRWSEDLELIHGREPGTFGGTFEDFARDIHPEDREEVLAAIGDTVTRGEDYRSDYRIVRPDGVVRWLAARGRVFRDDRRRAVRMAGVCTDITERKETERQLGLQYAVSRVLTESMSVEEAAPRLIEDVGLALGWELGHLWQVDEDGAVIRYRGGWHSGSSEAARFQAKSREFVFPPGIGLPGRVWSSGRAHWIPDVTKDENFPRAPFATDAGLHAAFGFPITLGNSVLGVIEFFSHRIREPDEGLLETTTAIGRQIGQYLERVEAEAAVAESGARKTAILRSALDAIITMSEDGTIVELNPAAEQMFGFAHEDAVGRELAGLIIPERLRERHRQALERHRRTGVGRVLGRRLELSARRSDGTEFPIELTITRVDMPGPALFTGYIRDITDRKRLEELGRRLLDNERKARAEAEAARERMTFLADASVVLASSLDFRKTLARVARLAVPRLADWCGVELVGADGSIQSVGMAHVDPEKVALAREYRRRYPPEEMRERGIANVIRTGTSELYEEIPEALLERVRDPEQREFIRRLDIGPMMIVPLIGRGRPVGAITFASSAGGRRFGQADLELAEDLGRRAGLAINNAKLYEERSRIARTLQRSLLPQRLPDIPGIEVAALYQPAGLVKTDVGGDFYDVFDAGDRSWVFVIGDVCGKGVDAAALTGLARHVLRAAAVRETTPSAALGDLNEVLRREDGDRFCTVALGRLEPGSGSATLTVACGGHPSPLVLRRNGSVEPVGTPGTLMGVFDDVEVQDRAVELRAGDAVVFYTDGLVDPRLTEAIDDAALHALLGTCREFDAAQIAECFRNAAADPAGQAPDDVAILVLRVTP